jgi:uncharacterized membrane protein
MMAMNISKNVSQGERIVCMAAGVALGVYASRRIGRRSGGSLALASAAALMARGASGYCPVNGLLGRGTNVGDTRKALAGSRGIRLEESVTIHASATSLYDLWRPLTNLPSVMRHVERVDVIDHQTSHWVVQGPVGIRFEWDAKLINDVKPHVIAWQSLPGSEVTSAGSVTFRERQSRRGLATEVTVTLQYDPVGGKAAALLAWLVGQSPSSMLREDLQRFKTQVEAREAPMTQAGTYLPRPMVGTLSGMNARR